MKKLIVTFLIVSAFTCGCTQPQNKYENLSLPEVNQVEQQESENSVSNQQNTMEADEKLHPIDKAERDCIAKVYSTYDMNACGYTAIDSWYKEIDKYLGLLKTITSKEEYANIIKAQEDWKKYQESEFVSISLIRNKQGSMYQTIAIGKMTEVVKQRALALKNLYEYLAE